MSLRQPFNFYDFSYAMGKAADVGWWLVAGG
jgi:hypothetical protein